MSPLEADTEPRGDCIDCGETIEDELYADGGKRCQRCTRHDDILRGARSR